MDTRDFSWSVECRIIDRDIHEFISVLFERTRGTPESDGVLPDAHHFLTVGAETDDETAASKLFDRGRNSSDSIDD